MTRRNIEISLGQVITTPGVLDALEQSAQDAAFFLDQHASGNWGIVDEEDWKFNDQALVEGERLLSAFITLRGDKLWIVTEVDRSSTCMLRPEEY